MATLQRYAQKRSEGVWVRSQPSVGVFEIPLLRDAIKLRGGATLPSTASDFVLSEEVRPEAPDVDQLLKRKKLPAEFSLTMYAKVPTTKGRLFQGATLLRDSFGVETIVATVLDYTGLAAGKTVTVTIDGTDHVLTEGADFTAAGSNDTTATSLAAAVHALTGVTATATAAEVRILRDQGIGEVVIASDALAEDLGLGEVRYTLATDILEKLLTIIHATHNSADYYRDCKVGNVSVQANGGDEAVFVFSGILGNSVSVHDALLVGTISDLNASSETRTSADEVEFQVDRHAFQLGPTAEDFAYCTIGTEHFKVTAYDRATKTATAFGCQFGSTPADHAENDKVAHYQPAADPEANDAILSMTLGRFTFDSNAYRIVSVEANKNENLNARLDEAFEAALTGYRRPLTGRSVDGTLQAYQQNQDDPTGSIAVLSTYAEAEAEAVASLRLGSATGPRWVMSWPHFRLGRPDKGEQDGEFTRSLPFQGLAGATPGNDGVALTMFS